MPGRLKERKHTIIVKDMEKIVFTNGCFDILHPGHIDLLTRARELGTKLIVGINSDDSVRKIKGSPRPFLSENERKEILLGLKGVDEVRIFDDLTPEKLIKEIKPDVLVKGGDWKISEIVGADFVLSNGGEVFSLPLKGEFSSSKIVEKIRSGKTVNVTKNTENSVDPEQVNRKDDFAAKSLVAHIELFRQIEAEEITNIENCAGIIYETLMSGNKLLFCGNGGSAADSQHLAAEFVGRYETERRAFPAIALTTDTSALTALGNDYTFERIFSRQVEALANEGDLLIAISTSGNSPNIISAVMTARSKGCKTLAMTGIKGKKLASLCDAAILIQAEKTARIQEAHITIGHIWCEILDAKVAAE